MKPHRFSLTFALSAILAIAHLYAGAWTQPKGSYYTKVTFINSNANSIFNLEENVDNRSTGVNWTAERPISVTDNALYFYGEYGIIDALTAQLSFPMLKRSSTELNEIRGTTTGGFAGDYEPALKFRLLDKTVVASISVGAKIPLGYTAVVDTLPIGGIDDVPPLGNGQTDLDAKLLFGRSFHPIPAYLTSDIGYRMRGGDFIDEIHWNIEAGYTFNDDVLARVLANGITATEEADLSNGNPIFPLDQERLRMGLGLMFKPNERMEFDLTVLNTVGGKNIPDSFELFVGFAIKG